MTRGASVLVLALLGCMLLGCMLLGCKAPPTETKDTPASPQASANPTPISTNTDAGLRIALAKDAGPPPSWRNAEQPFPPDTPLTKEPPAHFLKASFRFADAPPIPRVPEVNAQAAEALRRKLDPSAEILITPTRLRFALKSGFVARAGAEIRARSDVYGHLVMDGDAYRVAVPGALRAFFNEGRLDAAPLLPATPHETGTVTKRLGFSARKIDVTTRVGRLTLELAKVPETGEGGVLLCRLLLDLVNASPDTSVCDLDEVPLRAEYHWATHGLLFFEITDLKKTEGAPLLVPASTIPFSTYPIRVLGVSTIASPSDLAALRSGAQEPEAPPARGPAEPPPALRGNLDIVDVNDAPFSVWIDGVPVAWLPAGATFSLPGLYRGKYQLLARSFLGGSEQPIVTVSVPGRCEIGGKNPGN